MTEVEANDNVNEVEILDSTIEPTLQSCNSPIKEIIPTIEVSAEIQEWVLTSDNIYIIEKFNGIPLWMQQAIKEIIADPNGDLVETIQELYALIAAVDEGYHNEVYRLDSKDSSQDVHFESLKTSYENTAAAVVHIESTYASKDYAAAVAYDVVGAYINGGEAGAWLENSVSAIADVAYSAARSASSLNASINSTKSDVAAIAGDIEILKKQVDGEVVTWFVANAFYSGNVDPNGDPLYYSVDGPVINGIVNDDPITGKPYWCWLEGNVCTSTVFNDYYDDVGDIRDVRAQHTGDVYVYYKLVNGVKEIISTWRFGTDPDTGEYNWFIFADDIATTAYTAALAAQATADGKITTYYGDNNPGLTPGVTLSEGDLWVDSDGFATPTDLTPPFNNAGVFMRYDGVDWVEVVDARVTASVRRLDQATVDIGGVATAKGSLTVEATGSTGVSAVSGYQATATSGPDKPPVSEFRVFADKFVLGTSVGTNPNYAPFTVDTTTSPSQIKFNGIVEFQNLEGFERIVTIDNINYTLSRTSTIIDGSRITTGFVDAELVDVINLNADNITTGTLSADFIKTGTIDADSINVANLQAGNLKVNSLTSTGLFTQQTAATSGGTRILYQSFTLKPYEQMTLSSAAVIQNVDDEMSVHYTTGYDRSSGYVQVQHTIMVDWLYGYALHTSNMVLTRIINTSGSTQTVRVYVRATTNKGHATTIYKWWGTYHRSAR